MTQLHKPNPSTSTSKQEALFEALLRSAVNAPARQQITRRADDGPAPLSFAQQRLWFLAQLEPDNTAYNVFRGLRLTGKLNPTILEKGLNEIVQRHESLRTIFTVVDGQPAQVILPNLPISLAIIDLTDLPESERGTQAQQHIAQESQKVFDLTQGPLLQVTLLQLGEEEQLLLVVAHHLIIDGWSMGIFFRELSALYKAYLMGLPSPLAALPIQYADFAVWQREWLQGEIMGTQLTYWKQQLAGHPPVLDLPTDHPRPVRQTLRGGYQSIVIDKALTAELKSLSQKEGVTLFMTLLAAFQTLLYRYTGQNDILVGSPIAGRTRSEVEEVVGLFINTLVLRIDLSGNPTFQELLGRVRETALEAYNHQDLPFEKLVEELHPDRDLSRTPLFQVLFNMHNFAGSGFDVPGVTTEYLSASQVSAQFDLTLEAIERNGEIHLKSIYNVDLFEPVTIIRLLSHFKTLLQDIIANPNRQLSRLTLLTEEERLQLLTEWNDTKTDYPKDLCIHQLFEAQVERTPETIAVIYEGQQLTYRELNTRANQLAHHLKRHGIGPEILVGICMERSLEMVVGLLGILKAGGAYVPLDPSYPSKRLDFMIKDSQIQLLLTQKQLGERFLLSHLEVFYLDGTWDTIAHESTETPAINTTPNNLAYIIYTSGSTGRPKGALISHKAICNHMVWMQTEFGYDETIRVLQKTPFSFDASVWEFYAPLLSGGQLVMAKSDGHRDGEYLVKTIIEHEITTLQLVPSQLQLLFDVEGLEKCYSLRHVFCGGEALPVDLVNRFLRCLPETPLFNLYGPSEATIDTTFWKCESKAGQVINPIGRPIANAKIYILDSNHQPVPIGVPGELYIGGDGVGQGYLNRPELTAERFISDPFNSEAEALMYKTGDLARYLSNGNIEFLGRIDYQVKIRGFRIELGEIEAVLDQHPDMQESIVIVREDVPNDKRLVAYIVSCKGAVLDTDELRDHLRQSLPDYMIPSAFMTLEKLPLTPNGKVDRKALPVPDQTRPDLENQYVAPRTEIEEKIARIWAEILGLEQVGIHDNFFDLGGHSLLATQAVFRLSDTFEIKMLLRSLFERPTIAGLAKHIETISRMLDEQIMSDDEMDNREELVL